MTQVVDIQLLDGYRDLEKWLHAMRYVRNFNHIYRDPNKELLPQLKEFLLKHDDIELITSDLDTWEEMVKNLNVTKAEENGLELILANVILASMYIHEFNVSKIGE